jgi:hypothetical protein
VSFYRRSIPREKGKPDIQRQPTRRPDANADRRSYATAPCERRARTSMESRTRDRQASADAAEFVRFCYRRRRVGWPELYDEMCAVAGRGLYRGWGSDELGAEGIGFSLYEMPALAILVHRIVAEEHEKRAQLVPPSVVRAPVAAALAAIPADGSVDVQASAVADQSPDHAPSLALSLVGATAGA